MESVKQLQKKKGKRKKKQGRRGKVPRCLVDGWDRDWGRCLRFSKWDFFFLGKGTHAQAL